MDDGRSTMTSKLLVIDVGRAPRHVARTALVDVLRPGDLVVANDAATLPASLHSCPASWLWM